jgi:hypothetical protein
MAAEAFNSMGADTNIACNEARKNAIKCKKERPRFLLRGLFGIIGPPSSGHNVGSIELRWAGASMFDLAVSLWTIPAGLPIAEITYSG